MSWRYRPLTDLRWLRGGTESIDGDVKGHSQCGFVEREVDGGEFDKDGGDGEEVQNRLRARRSVVGRLEKKWTPLGGH